jgi:membrane glycosyltransferase
MGEIGDPIVPSPFEVDWVIVAPAIALLLLGVSLAQRKAGYACSLGAFAAGVVFGLVGSIVVAAVASAFIVCQWYRTKKVPSGSKPAP